MNNITMNGMKCILYLFGSLIVALPAPAASFDCAKAGTKVEKLICGDAGLSKLDDELTAAYKTALQDGKQADAIKQAQKQWMKVRNDCDDVACVKKAYEARLSSLAAVYTSTDDSAATKQSDKDNSQNGQHYHFQLTKGAGIPVCDAYLERLNTTKYEEPPFCGRPENDVVKGFTRLNRMPLSPADVHDLYPIISTFMSLANQKNLDWTDMNLQLRLTQRGQGRLTDKGTQFLQRDLDRGAVKMWRYDPAIDIDNDGVPDNVEVWQGGAVAHVSGKCGEDLPNPYSETGGSIMHQVQLAFVVTGNNDRLDALKTKKIFAHPSGGYRLPDGSFSANFRPIGITIGIFKYQDSYYFDTFFDSRGDFEDKRQHDVSLFDSLGVFLHKDGKTKQVCEYLMTDNESQNKRGAFASSEIPPCWISRIEPSSTRRLSGRVSEEALVVVISTRS